MLKLLTMRMLIIHTALFFLAISSVLSQETMYREKYRPRFHFSPEAHWMNDPNGLVYYQGEYHLFYQYYPDSTVWGPMHWGHAVSKDLVHWQHLPIALYPDSNGYIFSGSVVVDKNNSSGFQKGKTAPLVAIFTYHNMEGERSGRNNFQTQGIAYSTDKGRTWSKYTGNPVIKNPGARDFRDPKVMWHTASQQWILTLAAGNEIRFYRSADLKHWEHCGSFGADQGEHSGVWECPDLMEIATGQNSSKWVLLVSIGKGAPNGGSGTQYFVGQFDGKTFHNDNKEETRLWVDYGTDNYAGVTWSNTPDQRHIFLGWMSNWQYAQQVPTQPWRSAMTIPRELQLKQTDAGLRLISRPVSETRLLRKQKNPVSLQENKSYALSQNELVLTYPEPLSANRSPVIELSNHNGEKLLIGYDPDKAVFFIDRRKMKNQNFSAAFPGFHIAPRQSKNQTITLHLFIDQSSVELFADNGSVVMTDLFFPEEVFSDFMIRTTGKSATPLKATQYPLRSIWP